MVALQPRALSCPSCGASLEAQGGRKVKSIVCRHCTSHIDLTKPEFEILGKLDAGEHAPTGPVRLGMTADIDGTTHEVVGRIRFEEDGERWDEWVLLATNGKLLWLVEAEGRYEICRSMTPTTPIRTEDLYAGATVSFDGKHLRVREAGVARIVYLEGELTWRARVGDTAHYAEAALGTNRFSFEWTDEEIEFFRVHRITRGALGDMFGFTKQALALEDPRAATYRMSARLLGFAALAALLVALFGNSLTQKRIAVDNETKVAASKLKGGIRLGEIELAAGRGHYALHARAIVQANANSYTVRIGKKGSEPKPVLRFNLVGTKFGTEEAEVAFQVPETATYELWLTGEQRGGPEATTAEGSVIWSVTIRWFRPQFFFAAAVVLAILWLVSGVRANQLRATAMAQASEED